jgi:restriction system protein
MSIPDYQSLMLPLLRLASDGNEHRISEAAEHLARTFNLSADEQAELLPSRKQTVFANRAHWAKTYLSQAGLLESPRRAYFRITERGREVLKNNPDRIDVALLSKFPEFLDFKTRTRAERSEAAPTTELPVVARPELLAAATPDEVLRDTIKDLERSLSGELLQRVLSAPPVFFENLIVQLLLSMGYGGSREDAGRAIGKSGDGGIDGVIDQDPLGLDRVYVQAKRYKADSPVSEPEIRAFSGSLGAAKANKGVFVTTSYFTRPAIEFAERHPFKMVLIDGEQLTTLMIRHDVGVRVADTLHLKKVDEDFFSEE